MSDVETRLRELLDAKAGEMRVDPEIPRAVRRRAGRRRLGTGLAAGVVAVALVAAAGVGIRAAIGDRPQRAPGSGVGTEEWRGIWPQDTRAEAEAAQAAADAGDPDATWQRNPVNVLEAFAEVRLQWDRLFYGDGVDPIEAARPLEDPLTVHVGDCETVATQGCPNEADVTIERLLRPEDDTGIWFVTAVEVTPGPDDGATPQEVRVFAREFMEARNMPSSSLIHDVISRHAMDQYEAGENGLALWGPVDDPAFTGFGYRVGQITAADGDRYDVRIHISERFDDRPGEEYIERLLVGPGRTLRGDDLPIVVLEAYRLGPSPEGSSSLDDAAVRDFTTAFLEARLAGSGAEAFLTEVAAEQYANHHRGLHLYGEEHQPGLGGNYRGAEIVSVEAADAGSYQVVVSLRVEWLGDSDPSDLTEIIFVGLEGSRLMVRGGEGVDV